MRRRTLLAAAGIGLVLTAGVLLALRAARDDGLPREVWYPAWRSADPRAIAEPRSAACGATLPAIRAAGALSSPGGAHVLISAYGAEENSLRRWRLRREFGELIDPSWEADAWYVPTAEWAVAADPGDPQGGPDRKGRVWRRFERFDTPLETSPDLWQRAETEARRRAALLPTPPRDP